MPRGDRTGPFGMGPMTGRGAGYCAGFPVPGYWNPCVPWGFGRGGGRGFRWRHWFYATGVPGWLRPYPGFAPPSAEEEVAMLKRKAEGLTSALEEIRKRISELESEAARKEG